jgi:C_GCAxxG_C_C family probable redox protein
MALPFIFLIFLRKTEMERKENAVGYFRDGFSCAQSVVMAFVGKQHISVRAASAFGGGMGRMQQTCGAVTGAYIVFGLIHEAPQLPAETEKLLIYDRVRAFRQEFVKRNGTDSCSELLGEDLNTAEGKAAIKSKGLTENICEKCIRDAVEIIELIT